MVKTAEQTGPQMVGYQELLDPVLPTSKASYKTYRKMRRDPTIALARQLVIAPTLASPWSVEANEDAPEGAVEVIEEIFLPTRLHLLKTAMLGCIDFGWQGYEKIFEMRDDGLLKIAKFKPLLHDYTDILVDPKTGGYAGLQQENVNVKLDVAHTFLANIDVEGTDWYGQNVLENVRDAYDKWKVIEAAADRYDKKIAGSHWVVRYPRGTSVYNGVEMDNYEVAQKLIANLQSSGTIAVPRKPVEFTDDLNADTADAWVIELVSDSGSSRGAFVERQAYLDKLKVRGFGFPERAILEGQFGTKAEAEAHADIAIINMEVRHAIFVLALNWHGVNQVLRLNYGPEAEGTVWLEAAPIADLALQFLRDVYTAFLGNPEGFASEFGAVDWTAMRDRLGLPVKPEDEQIAYDEPQIEDDEPPEEPTYAEDDTREGLSLFLRGLHGHGRRKVRHNGRV